MVHLEATTSFSAAVAAKESTITATKSSDILLLPLQQQQQQQEEHHQQRQRLALQPPTTPAMLDETLRKKLEAKLLEQLLPAVANLLGAIVRKNEQQMQQHHQHMHHSEYGGYETGIAAFEMRSAPEISILNYVERIAKYAKCSPSCFILALVYLDTVLVREPTLQYTSKNIHRFLLASLRIANKMLDDFHYNNEYFSTVCGVSKKRLMHLENEFLKLIGFELHVQPEIIESYSNALASFTTTATGATTTTTTAAATKTASTTTTTTACAQQVQQQRQQHSELQQQHAPTITPVSSTALTSSSSSSTASTTTTTALLQPMCRDN